MGTNNLTPPSRYSGLDQGRAECEEEPCMDKRFAEYGATFTIIIVPRGVSPALISTAPDWDETGPAT